jgi:hypothetical protein
MPGQGDKPLTPAQSKAMQLLSGLISSRNVGGRTLCCLVGAQGSGKTYLVKHLSAAPEFGKVHYVPVNQKLLGLVSGDDQFRALFEAYPSDFQENLARFGKRLRKELNDIIRKEMLDEGLTILDHLELVLTLGLDPVTLWYNDAQGQRRLLLVLTGRLSGQRCLVGQHTLTRGDQPIVELEATQ